MSIIGRLSPKAKTLDAKVWQPKTPGLALPAELGWPLHLLDDAQLDRLAEAVADEGRRHGRSAPDSSSLASRSLKTTPAKAARARLDRAATVTAGQKRLILAAFDAGLRPTVIAKEFRASRSTVQHVITDAKHESCRTER